MDETAKEQLLARFQAYLDAAETEPAGEDDEAPDLFTLLAELAALKNEVKIESRQVKTALDQFRELFDTLRQSNTRLGEALERQQEAARSERAEAERGLLLELLELHDRLRAGCDQAHRYRPGWMARRGGAGAFVAGMAEGMAMNLRRLDETLARRGIRPLESVGRAFDPQTMHAAEVTRDRTRRDGEVTGELRRGFVQHGRLLRPAEVIVNRTDKGNES